MHRKSGRYGRSSRYLFRATDSDGRGKRERPLRQFWQNTRSRRYRNASRISTGRRQGGRPHRRGSTWIESRRKGKSSTDAERDAGVVGRRSPRGSRYCAISEGPKRGKSGRTVWYAVGRSKGLVTGGLGGEEPGDKTVAVVNENHSEEIQ